MKEALGMECFSLKVLSEEGSFTRALEDMLKKAPDTGISLRRGTWNQEGISYTGDFE
jgi:hypothetical protein